MEYEKEYKEVEQILMKVYEAESYWCDPDLINETIKAIKQVKSFSMEHKTKNMNDHRDVKKVYEAEEIMEYEKWIKEIPFIKFDSDWEVKIIPPLFGAVVRFQVQKGESIVSVYLDCYDTLGFFGQPYWEVYPYDGDVYRCEMNNTEELLKAIRESITQQLDEKV